ncbi:MAG TPA: Flp pilus assembly protein CpaB [Candidatus Baltobacteraceae bacterium]|nr:Flp pilus assembly protein CpaB [Candidatus Baltobacteraceae bacterium]
MNTRRITLLVAVVLAIGTGILTLRYLSSIQKEQQVQQVENRPIIVASRDIAARARITPDMLTRTVRPGNQIEPGALSDPKQAEGDIALITIPSGSTITETKVGRPAEVGLTVRLKPGLRALTIPGDRIKGVSGLISPGDRVDVLASVPKAQGKAPRTMAIIRGALVLAINTSLETAGATPSPDTYNPGTITLGITADQAKLLTTADLNTTLRLALRSPQEPVRSLPADELTFNDLGTGGRPNIEPRNVPPPVAPARPPSLNPAITIIDGDKVTAGGQ